MKKCPQCAEDVKSEAIKCRYCGADLVGGPMRPAVQQPPVPPIVHVTVRPSGGLITRGIKNAIMLVVLVIMASVAGMFVMCGKAAHDAAKRSDERHASEHGGGATAVTTDASVTPTVVPATGYVRPNAGLVTESASLAVASFNGERLQDCTEAHVTIGRLPPLGAATGTLTAAQAVAMTLNEALGSARGKATEISGGKANITGMIALFSLPGWSQRTVSNKQLATLGSPAALAKMFKGFQDISWSYGYDEQLKRGDLAKVDSCVFPDRVSFGSCVIEDAADEIAGERIRVEWSIQRSHYDVNVADTDAGMKNCVVLGGRWTAPSRDDPAVASERLRQHAAQFREMTAPRSQ